MNPEEKFSLLFPQDSKQKTMTIEDQTIEDLELNFLLDFLVPSASQKDKDYQSVKKILLNPSTEEATIAYRQDIIEHLLNHEDLLQAFETLLPIIDALNYYRAAQYNCQSVMYTVVSRICELESYLAALDTLKDVFDRITETESSKAMSSQGLEELYQHIKKTFADPVFQHLKKNLPQLAAQVRDIRSVNIGVNLGSTLRPVEATLVSINTESFHNKSDTIFSRIFAKETEELSGIAPLHSMSHDQGFTPEKGVPASDKNPLLQVLFQDLADLLDKICKPIQKALRQYITVNTRLFTVIREELVFYIHATKLLLKLHNKSKPICKAQILNKKDGIMHIENNFDINLFLQLDKKDDDNSTNKLVTNSVKMDDQGRILIITGPNQGGKTVFNRAVGLTQILFQGGLFVPGTKAEISPVDQIFTHFQIEEHLSDESGRFGDEAKRMHEIMERLTSNSLLLMNESFASTNYTESLYIARDILKILSLLGTRVVFSTHFHDLAEEVDSLNQKIKGPSKLISLVSMVEEANEQTEKIKRTYKIIPHKPMGKSYARDIAHKYGIGYEQLKTLLKITHKESI